MAQTIFKDLALAEARKQDGYIDNLLEETGFLQYIPMKAASSGFYNTYQELVAADSMGRVELNDVIPMVTSESELKQVPLSMIAGQMFCKQDTAKLLGNGDIALGRQRYFEDQIGPVLTATGSATEKSIIYNSLRSHVLTVGGDKKINAGGEGDTNYTILAVTWNPNAVTGLYAPSGYGGEAPMSFQIDRLNGGELYNDYTTGIPGYGVQYKTSFGFQIASDRYTSGIFNIDIANSKLPTFSQVDQLLNEARADQKTMLLMHPNVKSAVFGGLKTSKLELRLGDSIDTMVDSYNDIPIITSFNFLKGTETNVSFA